MIVEPLLDLGLMGHPPCSDDPGPAVVTLIWVPEALYSPNVDSPVLPFTESNIRVWSYHCYLLQSCLVMISG